MDGCAVQEATQVIGQGLGCGVALARLLFQALQADGVQVARHSELQPRRRHRLLVADLLQEVGRTGLAAMSLQGIASGWGNVGYMDVPLCLAAFGDTSLPPAMLSVIVISVLCMVVGVMLVEHRLELLSSIADRAIVLDLGKLIAEGDPDTVFEDPRVRAAYFEVEAA